jgi:hypothetical protein
MKRLVPLLVLFALAFGSLGKAQSAGFGIYSGWPTWIGAQFQTDGLRLGVGLSSFGFGADAGLMLGESPLAVAPGIFAPGTELSWYYGAGMSAGFWLFRGVGDLYVFPHGLAGIEAVFPGQPFSFYAEGQLGFGFYTRAGVGWPALTLRAGLIFRP